MEPLDAVDPLDVPTDEPIVVDAAGRMWRIRYRPSWVRLLTRGAPVLVGVVLLALLLMLRI